MLYLDELSKDSVDDVVSTIRDGGLVLAKSVDPRAIVSAIEVMLSRHEGETSGLEIERLSEGGPFLIHGGGVRILRRREGVLIRE